jgi:GAF domain-containing protein
MIATEGDQDLTSVARRYGALLDVAATVASGRDLPDLLQDLASRLQVESFEILEFALYDPSRAILRERWVTGAGSSPEHDIQLESTSSGEVFRTQQPLFVPDIQERAPDLAVGDHPKDIRSLGLFPLLGPAGCLGTIGFASTSVVAWDSTRCELLTRIAGLVALAADRVLAHQREDEYQNKLAVQRGHAQLLVDINKLLFSELDPQSLFAAISRSLHSLLRHDFAFLILRDVGTGRLRIHAMDSPLGTGYFQTGLTYSAELTVSKDVLESRRSLLLNGEELASYPAEIAQRLFQEGVRSALGAFAGR